MSMISSTGGNDRSKAPARVVAFVTDHSSEMTVADVFGELNIPFTLVRRGAVKDAIEYLGENSSPKVLIVDVTGSEMPLSQVNDLAESCEPGVKVIVIGDKNDIGLFRDLMQLGVSDYLAKPLTRELLKRSLSAAQDGTENQTNRQRSGKLIALTGARGGVGTTTMTSNLGWLLANKVGRRVAMVDLDLQFGSLALSLDQKPTKGLREALENHHRVDPVFVERSVVPIDQRLTLLSSEEPLGDNINFDQQAVDTLFGILERQFHYVLVDLPRIPGQVHQHVLQNAEIRVLVADPTMSSVRDTIRLLTLLGGEELGKQTIVILNRRSQSADGEITLEEFEKAIGRRVDHVVPFARGMNAANNSGEVIATQRSSVTDALTRVAYEFSGKSHDKPSPFAGLPFGDTLTAAADKTMSSLSGVLNKVPGGDRVLPPKR